MRVTQPSTAVTLHCQSSTQAIAQTRLLTMTGHPPTPAALKSCLLSTQSKPLLSPGLELNVDLVLLSSRQATHLCITHDLRLCHPLLTLLHWKSTTVCSRRTRRVRGLLLHPVNTSLRLDLQARARLKSLDIDPARAVCDVSRSPFPSSAFLCFCFTGSQEFKQARRNLLCPLYAISFFSSSRSNSFLKAQIFHTVGRSNRSIATKGSRGTGETARTQGTDADMMMQMITWTRQSKK
jgi:hypothetical protein